MQTAPIQGYIFFRHKTIDDIITVFGNFRLDKVRFFFFKELRINDSAINAPGVFVLGEINNKYTIENVVRLFCKLMKTDIADSGHHLYLGLSAGKSGKELIVGEPADNLAVFVGAEKDATNFGNKVKALAAEYGTRDYYIQEKPEGVELGFFFAKEVPVRELKKLEQAIGLSLDKRVWFDFLNNAGNI